MDISTKTLIKQLNELIQVNNDRIMGYEVASRESSDFSLRNVFYDIASDSRKFKAELSKEVALLGGIACEKTSTSGKMNEVWKNVRVALISKQRKAIVDACELEEIAAVEVYTNVIKSDSYVPASIKEVIFEQRQKLQQDFALIRALGHSVKNRELNFSIN
jgi:uncharacterized protein (TIGR02284 family)